MKIKEAVEIINGTTSTVSAKYLNNALRISSKSTEIYGDWFLKMPMNAISWESIRKEWGGLSPNIKAKDLARVMDVIQRLLDTPVEERFPEKKYRLRWIDDRNRKANYVCLDMDATWHMITLKNFADTFAESGLEQLKKDNPHLAPAIDAMKEEVKDDE